MSPPRQMILSFYYNPAGHHEGAWRLPSADPRADVSVAAVVSAAVTAERAGVDAIFFADYPRLTRDISRRPSAMLEPSIVSTAIAMATSDIGIIGTYSTTYNDPYNLSRRLAALVHAAGDRIGWNVVTTAGDAVAENFSMDAIEHDARYERAGEFLDVCTRLWHSWGDSAVVADKATGRWGDHNAISPAGFNGDWFRVGGALNIPVARGSEPVIVQAGQSEAGRAFAAKHAEVLFTAHSNLVDASEYANEMRLRFAHFRRPKMPTILPGLAIITASTDREARRLADSLAELTDLEGLRRQLARRMGVSPEELPFELPASRIVHIASPGPGRAQTQVSAVLRLATTVDTVRDLVEVLSASRGHQLVIGGPETVANFMRDWFESGAVDGFNIMPAVLPQSLESFCSDVMPLLRSWGLIPPEGGGRTLRERLNLQ